MVQAKTMRIGAVAGLIAGAVELVPILPIQAALGVSPLRVFQSIASGAFGRDAYIGGVATATAGVFFHFLIAVVAGMIFAAAAARWPVLRQRAWLAGALYGAVAYVVMTRIVVPLSAVAYKQTAEPAMMAVSLAIHIVTFGLPIALYVHRHMPARTS